MRSLAVLVLVVYFSCLNTVFGHGHGHANQEENPRSLFSHGSNTGFRKPLKRGPHRRPPFEYEYDLDNDKTNNEWDDDEDDWDDRSTHGQEHNMYGVGSPRLRRPKTRFPSNGFRNPAHFEHTPAMQRLPLMLPDLRSRPSNFDRGLSDYDSYEDDDFGGNFGYDWSFPSSFSSPVLSSVRRDGTRHEHHNQHARSAGATQMQAEDAYSAIEKPPPSLSGVSFASRRAPSDISAALESSLDEKSNAKGMASRLGIPSANIDTTAGAAEEALAAAGRSAAAANGEATSRNNHNAALSSDGASAAEQLSAHDPSARRNLYGQHPNYNGNNFKHNEYIGNPDRFSPHDWPPPQQNGMRFPNSVPNSPPMGYESRPVINTAFRGRIYSYSTHPSWRQPHRRRRHMFPGGRSLEGSSGHKKSARSMSMDPLSSPFAMPNQNPYQSNAANLYGMPSHQGMMHSPQQGHSHNRQRYPSSPFESGMSPHGMASLYSQAGVSSPYMQPGASSSFSQSGMSANFPQSGMSANFPQSGISAYSQPGMSQLSQLSSYPQASPYSSGVNTAYPQSDMSSMYSQPGVSSAYSPHGLPIKRLSKEN